MDYSSGRRVGTCGLEGGLLWLQEGGRAEESK